MEKNILYFECAEGIAGDMTVASLLSLGADEAGLFRTLAELQLEGYTASTEEYFNRGILTKRFHVTLADPTHPDLPGERNTDDTLLTGAGSAAVSCHEQEHVHDHGHDHFHAHEHDHFHEHEQGSGHCHDHEHGHDHHVHGHTHRNLEDVFRILMRLSDPAVRGTAARIFRILAEAEAAVHGKALEDVHFHEVGAVDSIVDIVAAAFCLTNLGITECVLTTITEGSGTIRCAHGELPVPVPAVLAIAQSSGLPLRPTDLKGERVTPTGAAILAALWNGGSLPSSYRIVKTGYASGHRAYDGTVSMLRAMLLSAKEPAGAGISPALDENRKNAPFPQPGDAVWKLETNIDDANGEALGLAMEKLLSAGALDVFYTPVFAKKNRPAYLLTVLCREDQIRVMEALIFRHTTSIGIRRCRMERTILPRTIRDVETPYGTAKVKCCSFEENEFLYPEYESIRAIGEMMDTDYETAREYIRAQYLKENPD